RHDDPGRVRLHVLGGLRPGVELRDALQVLASLPGRDASDDVGAVAAVVERVEGALAAGHPRDREPRVLVDQHGHQRTVRWSRAGRAAPSLPARRLTRRHPRGAPTPAPRPSWPPRPWCAPCTRWAGRPPPAVCVPPRRWCRPAAPRTAPTA